MRLSDEAKTQVRPLDFWIAVGAVIVLLGGMGIFEIQTGHVPDIPRWLSIGSLLLVWVVCLWHMFRFGRSAFPRRRVAILIGYTIFAGGHLWSHPPAAVSWLSNAGSLLLGVAVLSQFFTFSKQHNGASSEIN